jgi:predicted phage terminase large subunit-like protein
MELLRRRKARNGLIDFIEYTKPSYAADRFHRTLCHYFDLWIDGKIRRLMVFAPPQHGKTEIFSRRGPAYLFGRKPNARLIAASGTAKLAGRNNRDVQRIIESEAYRRLFPGTQLSNIRNRSGSDLSYLRNTEMFEIVGCDGSYQGVGVGQQVVGNPAEYLIADDPVAGSEQANSPTMREALWEWYIEEFSSRLAENGSMLIMHQRWHRDDLAGRIIRNITVAGEQWTVLSFPALAPDEPESYDHRQPGEALAPSRFSAKTLQKKKADMPRNSWSALYDQNPRPEGGTEWPAEYFGPDVWFDEWPRQWAVKVLSLDASKGKKETRNGDYSAFIKLMIGIDGTCYVEAELDRIDVKSIAEWAVAYQKQFHADSVPVESLQFQELFEPEFVRVGRERGVQMPVVPVEDMTPKPVRIRRIGPFLARREMRFKNNSPGTKLLVDQLMDFPNGDHDDGPDALDMALQEGFRLLAGVDIGEEHVY